MKKWISILPLFFSFSLVNAQVDNVFWEKHNIHQEVLDIENDCLELLNNKEEREYNKTSISDIIQKQVEAYNSHDLEAFLSFYSDSVAAYIFPNYPLGKGKEALMEEYGRQFRTEPNMQVEIKKRICLGDYVIDKEFATGMAGGNTLEALAIYKVENNLITTVWFIYK